MCITLIESCHLETVTFNLAFWGLGPHILNNLLVLLFPSSPVLDINFELPAMDNKAPCSYVFSGPVRVVSVLAYNPHLGPQGPKQTSSAHSPLTESKGREMSDGETGKQFISMRPTPGRQWTGISKTVSKKLKTPLAYVRTMWDKGLQVAQGV